MGIDVTQIILLSILTAAVAMDLQCRRIPNWLTGPTALAGLSLHSITNQLTGLMFSLEGIAIGFGVFIILYVFGWMGAGDVKLFAAVGSFLGPVQTVSAAIVIALIGGLLALVVIGFDQGWRRTGLWLWSYVQAIFLTKSAQVLTPLEGAAPKVPYAVAIGLGTIGSYWWYPVG